jgi:amino acid adenylation domain-containing protein
MTVADLLFRLRELDIELRAESGKLVVNAPKGALSPELGDELRRRKAEILGFLELAEAGAVAPTNIPRAELLEAEDGALIGPASFGQGRLFYLDQLEPGLAVYNVTVAFELRGAVTEQQLRAALNKLTQRHSVLRSTLELRDGEVVLRIPAEFELPLLHKDLTALEPEPRERELRALLSEEARRPFDLTRGPLIRALHVQTDSAESVLALAAHHVLTDGWSQELMEAELLALLNGEDASLEPLAIQYVDYAAWQRAAEESPSALQHWTAALAAPRPVLELPSTRVRPAMAPTEGSTSRLPLPAALIESLAAVGKKHESTLFMVLLSAYAVLLHRLTGQSDFIIGTPVANREHADTLKLQGFFANTVAIRIDTAGNPSFLDVLRRTRESCIKAFAHQSVPFERLVELLQVERDLSRSPIFQTIFAFEDAESAKRVATSGAVRIVGRETISAEVARTDLSLWVSAHPEGLLATAEYPTALFDSQEIGRLLQQFATLLRAIPSRADIPIARLPLLEAEEQQRILRDFNATAQTPPPYNFASELFSAQAALTPNAVAARHGARAWTYAELDQRANQLAHTLAANGVGAFALVGVFLPRSLDMLACLHAIWRVGAAYVPIDPEYPVDRIAHMVEDSAARLVISNNDLRTSLPESCAVLLLDREAATIDAQPTAPPTAPAGDGSSAAYVIYTSGSTGKPKGVAVPHRAFLNFIASMRRYPGIQAEDILVAVTTLSFDIAGLELHLPLAVGATVVIASADQSADGAELLQLLRQSNATFMQATPSTWRLLLNAGFAPARSFKILCGGEAFPADLAAQLTSLSDQVFNMYGPTETTVWSTVDKLEHGQPLTIGKPIDNTEIYILDALGEPQPVAVPGELVIGGLGVALGYLNRPELTQERFIPDPFSARPGATMYKTGDLASFRDDGRIVYHRRLDHQVKVRGYRIELGEIETVLAAYESIKNCAVIVREDQPGDTRLCAYYAVTGLSPTASDLRKHLRQKLPDYMLPQHFTELPSLPLTPAGKIDKKGLPAPQGVVHTKEQRLPNTPAERLIASVWKEVLKLEQVSASDNFFELGGHSLLSMVVIGQLQKQTGIRIPPRELLLSSLEQLAGMIASAPGLEADTTGKTSAPEPVQPSHPTRTHAEPQSPNKESRGLLSRLKGKLFGG